MLGYGTPADGAGRGDEAVKPTHNPVLDALHSSLGVAALHAAAEARVFCLVFRGATRRARITLRRVTSGAIRYARVRSRSPIAISPLNR